jgi:hypothetical protein
LTVWWFFVALSLAEEPSNIEASRSFSGDPVVVMEWISDAERLSSLLPRHCARKWSAEGKGVGARFDLTYTMGMWRRRLSATVTRSSVAEGVDWDHHGDRGFITRWTVSDGEIGVTTWIAPPPWPFKRVYYRKIKPKWTLCYRLALDRLAEAGEANPSATSVAK